MTLPSRKRGSKTSISRDAVEYAQSRSQAISKQGMYMYGLSKIAHALLRNPLLDREFSA
jgi:hypothetical protein